MRVMGRRKLKNFLTDEIETITGGKFSYESDPVEAARRIIDHIDKKREDLKLKPVMYEVPYKGEADIKKQEQKV